MVPVVPCLLGAIQGLDEPSCVAWWCWLARNVNVDWHFRIHFGFEIRRFYVLDFMLEVVLSSVCHLNTKSRHLADACMCFDVVDAKTLAKTLGYESSFESVDEPIGVRLDFEDKTRIDGSNARR